MRICVSFLLKRKRTEHRSDDGLPHHSPHADSVVATEQLLAAASLSWAAVPSGATPLPRTGTRDPSGLNARQGFLAEEQELFLLLTVTKSLKLLDVLLIINFVCV